MVVTYFRAQVSLAYDSAIPEDVSVNVWHVREFEGASDPELTFDAIQAGLINFYGEIQADLSEHIAATGHRVKIFDMEDAPPRAPVRDTPFGLVTSSSGFVPNEVAICLSYRSAIVSGTNRRRATGRVYLGPFSSSAIAEDVGDSRVAAAVRTDIIDSVENHLLPWVPQPPDSLLEWCLFSRSDALGLAVGAPQPPTEPTYTNLQLQAGFKVITSAWVDDAFDTQRRRGLRPTTRTNTA